MLSKIESDQLIHLSSDTVSVVLRINSGTLGIAYWGPCLSHKVESINPDLFLDTFNFNDLDNPIDAGFWRENSKGWPGVNSLLGHHKGGNFSPDFRISNVSKTASSATINAADIYFNLQVTAEFNLLSCGTLLVDNKITNLNSERYELNSLSTWLPLPNRATEVISFTGRWVKERQPQRGKIQVGRFIRDSFEGRSGHDGTIAMLATTDPCNFQVGEVWSCALAWSGNTRHQIEKLSTGMQSIGAEELLLPGEISLAQNESYQCPTAIFGYSATGIDGLSNQYYQWLRSRENHPTRLKSRPLTLNVWEAVYFDHDLTKLTELAKVAREIGVERFVLDDGWFNLRRDDHAGLGDWWVDKTVWPNGLYDLIQIVRDNGMEFGLWFEPEMVNPDSELFRNHPDWILQSGGRIPPLQRHQLVLNLANQEVFDYLFQKIDALLSEYQIDYIKWDHNRVLIEPGFKDRAVVHQQTNNFYRLVKQLKQKHPGLEIESCASGGARIDLGVAQYVDRFWTSDCNEALERNYIQRWTGIAIPPELLGTHIGPPKSHTTGRVHNLSFRAITALFGHAGIEWDITKADPQERILLREWIDYYKMNRDLLHSGNVVRVQQSDDAIWVHGVVAIDKSKAIFSVAHLAAVGASKPPLLQFAGLNPAAKYEIRIVQPAGLAETIQNQTPTWASGKVVSGELILNHGLRGEKIQPENAYLIEMKQVN